MGMITGMMTIFFHRYIYKTLIFVALIILLSGCSSTRFLYSFLEGFIKDEISFFFDLDQEEKILVSQQVSDMVYWHRSSMLPNYANYLNDIADKIEVGKYDASDIADTLTKGRELIEKTVTGLTPYASKFLVSQQTPKAIEFMKKKMTTRNQERLTEVSKTDDILFEERLERLTSSFERFTGELNDAQMTLLKEHASATLGESKIRLNIRIQRQKVFLAFISTQPSEVELTVHLNKLLLSNYAISNPVDKDFSEASLSRFQELLIKILAISSTSQRETLISKFRNYAADFKKVSGYSE